MIIKNAITEEEINQAYHIRTIVFVNEQGVSMDEEIDEFDQDAIHFVGYSKDKPIAASRLRYLKNYGKLERICIIQEERGKSYGTQMIKKMEDTVLKEGYSQTILNAQTLAVPFYEQQGYHVISDEFLDAGIPHVTMKKQFNM